MRRFYAKKIKQALDKQKSEMDQAISKTKRKRK